MIQDQSQRKKSVHSQSRSNTRGGSQSRGRRHHLISNRGGPVITDEIVDYLDSELARLWREKSIDEFHQETFLAAVTGMPRDFSAPMIAREIENLKKNHGSIQHLQRAILAREECLTDLEKSKEKIEDAISKENYDEDGGLLVDGFPLEEDLMDSLCHQIHALRLLSLNVVDCIVKWRESILYAYSIKKQDVKVSYIYKDENYLTKMKSDTKWLGDSPVNKYFNFSNKSDPFLVLPSTATRGRKKRGNGEKLVVPLDNYLMKRIRASEMVLMGEAVLQRNSPEGSSKMIEGQKGYPPLPPPSKGSAYKREHYPQPRIKVKKKKRGTTASVSSSQRDSSGLRMHGR